ncbi:MAG: TIR domain-containing protein [Chloroflexi bacterium]|nr:MAG: TIR domain-containing protein [Chloroflexota bacterium]
MTDTTQGANGRVFISYSRKDKAFVQQLHTALDGAGVQAWVDWEGIELASDWMATITNAIQGTDAFLFVISPDSLHSRVCADELCLGLQLNKKLIPILYREPDKGTPMHEKLAATNWVYLRQEDNFAGTLPKLVESINTDLDWVRQHTQLLGQAAEWEKKNKDSSFLLNGVELADAERWMTEASGKANRQVLPLQAEYISASRKAADRRQRLVLAGVSFALVLSIVLSIFALLARSAAKAAEAKALTSEAAALTSESVAITRQYEAATAQANAENSQLIAEDKTRLAKANFSAAQSQVYQSRAGELDTSTLLAIDSYQREASFQAENLIRVNTSRLAMPVQQMSQGGAIWEIEWTPDYKYFVTPNVHNPASKDSVSQACVWRADNGEKVYCVQHENDVNDAIFTRDGQYLITASADNSVRFWNAADGEEIQEKRLTFEGAVIDLDVSDAMLAIGRKDKFLTLLNLKRADSKPVHHAQTESVCTVRFSPNGALLALALTNGDVRFWQAANGGFYRGPRHVNSNYVALAFSPDSKWLVSGGGDSLARLTKRDGTIVYPVPHGDWVEDVAFGPDPSWYVTVSDDNKVRILDTVTGQEKLRMSHANFVQKVKVSPDGQWIASTGYDRVVRIWDAASGSQMLEFPLKANGSAISFNQDGTRVIAADEGGNLSIWDISSLASRIGYIAFTEYVHEARLTPSGEYLVINADDYRIWKIPAAEISRIKDGIEGDVILKARSLTYDMAISPDSKWVVAAEYDSENPQNNRGLLVSLDGGTQFPLQHGGQVTGVAFDKDSRFALTSGHNGLVSFWDVSSGEKQAFNLDNSERIHSLAVSPVDDLAVVGLHNMIKVWSIGTRQPVDSLIQIGDIISLAFSKDGKWLATGSAEGTVILWQVDGTTLTRTVDPLTGNLLQLKLNGRPEALAFSPDGKWLVGGSSSGFANLWDVASVQELARIPHGDTVTGVSFSLDGSQLFTVSRKVVRIWNVSAIPPISKDQLIPSACAHLVNNLSREDWDALFDNEKYRLLCPDLPEEE